MASRDPDCKGEDPKLPRNMCFAKKHKKTGLKKVQGNNARAVYVCTEAVKAPDNPKEARPEAPKVTTSSLPATPSPSSGSTAVPRLAGLQALPAKDSGSNQSPGSGCRSTSAPAQVPKGTQGPCEGCAVRASMGRCEDRRTGVTPGLPSAGGWGPPLLFI
ncbi:60S ribosomal protein L29 [Fukomys damarensis]|uniref:60S ribosomal protein L29 n=1 Tax=Fukomys damarensis TaxID=885580 RepID=A0A091DCY5_FUKDA|nr:60S ribosomal protein L29 [Fukomys damarensis]